MLHLDQFPNPTVKPMASPTYVRPTVLYHTVIDVIVIDVAWSTMFTSQFQSLQSAIKT